MTDIKCGLLYLPSFRGGEADRRIDEMIAVTLPFPFVPAIWHVGRVYNGRCKIALCRRSKLRSIDMDKDWIHVTTAVLTSGKHWQVIQVYMDQTVNVYSRKSAISRWYGLGDEPHKYPVSER